MSNLGTTIDIASDEWLEFAENMRIANLAIPDFSKLREDLETISSILNSLDFGKSISEESY
jgi:hypothetical protein